MLDRSIAERRADDEPGVLAAQRRAGLAAFEEAVMPVEADEHWKYVELDFELDDLVVPHVAGPELPETHDAGPVMVKIVDGFVTVAESLPASVTIETFSSVAQRDAELFARAVRTRSDDIFLAGSQAFSSDGILIHVGRNVVLADPIVVDIQSVTEGAISFPRVSVAIDENAEASVVLLFRSSDGSVISAPVVESTLQAAARLAMTSVQTWGKQTIGLGYQRVVLGRDASMKMGEVGLGGALGRLDLSVDLEGDGCSYLLNGVSFGDGDQVLDYRMVLNHRGRNTSSDVLLKGAVEDRAESVFTGLLRIDEGATNTSAFENNRNLVLSGGAKAHSVPNLEILCDDVVCGHGSTVGPLEEEHLYYLASRGLGQERAERVLVKGFFDEVIDKLPAQAVASSIRAEVERKFVAAQVAGRLG